MLKVLVVLQCLLAPLPSLLLLGLYGLSARAQQLIGKFPQAFVNDPANIGYGDSTYQGLDLLVSTLLGGTLCSLLLWVPLTIATLAVSDRAWVKNRSRRVVIAGWIAIALYLVGIVVLWVEPTHRLAWYFD